MSEEHERKDQDRWRELADLLGLPPESQQRPVSEKREPAPPAHVPAHVKVETESRGMSLARLEAHEEPAMPEPIDESPAPTGAAESASSWEPGEPAALTDESVPPETPGEEPDDRSRRRRRGRRGRRGGRRDREAPERTGAPTEPGAERGAGERESTEPRPERPTRDDDRRVRREPPDDEDLPEEPEAELPSEEPAVSPDDSADEPEESFAEWNVPSWTELIDSLYRPGR
jgi:hypothetical protein